MPATFLVRYGCVPEVARFAYRGEAPVARGDAVVVRSHRGLQLGDVLEGVSRPGDADEEEIDFEILRGASADDLAHGERLKTRCEGEFDEWRRRIDAWNLPLELIDLERTLDDEKLILYVLAERGSATTMLALQAAAAGLGVIEVQPVTSSGLVATGNGGCGSGGCGCSH